MKKRYQIALNKENMEALQKALAEIGFHERSGIVSVLIDEYIKGMLQHVVPVLKRTKAHGGNITLGEFFQMVGTTITEMEDEQMNL